MDLEDIIYIEKKLICGNLNDIDLVYDELDFFQTLNRFAYQNVGLFCLNETYIYNYKRIIEKYEDERYKYTRELLESYTFIMRFENLTNEEKDILDNLVKYNIKDKDIDLLSSNYDIPYMQYDNKYHSVDKDKLYKYLNNKLLLSYTALDNY